ncbi:sperm-associated antigen 4 protein-like [Grus americana]|uniref:sperm-associated antigen 4 protein-like n=1 Tax=Grus americana TaxID=9117 RepID=UPI0024079CA0|nr:sperm-associated antigen 4 protein-like [Grus americana]
MPLPPPRPRGWEQEALGQRRGQRARGGTAPGARLAAVGLLPSPASAGAAVPCRALPVAGSRQSRAVPCQQVEFVATASASRAVLGELGCGVAEQPPPPEVPVAGGRICSVILLGTEVRLTGSAIDLQRSSSSSAWLCRVFWFLCAPPHLDTFVQADASPGYCWPFQGSQSEVLIRLPAPVQPMAITIQHASKTASPLGTVSSAPRDFTVSGLDEEGEDETLLGTFTYAMQQEPTQTFPLQNGIPRAFQFLKLGIQSNWGKPGYTCIRRVQVYGKIAGTNAISQTHVQTSPN